MTLVALAADALAWASANPGTAASLVVGDAVFVSSVALYVIPHDTTNPTLVRVRRAAEWVALNARPTLLAVEEAIEAARRGPPTGAAGAVS